MARGPLAWLVGAAFVVAAGFAILGGGSTPSAIDRGSVAPPFSLVDVRDGSPITLDDQEGRVVLLNFWATWCKPCEDEMPAMERLHRLFQGQDFQLIAISVDDDPAAVSEFRDRLGLSFPIAVDAGKKIADAYQTFRFPETFLIDREGRIVERFIGPKDWDGAAYVRSIAGLIEAGRESEASLPRLDGAG